MTTPEPLRRLLAAASEADTDALARLHARLVQQATADKLLDVAYRTLGISVGTLLLAASHTGLVRIAYPNEGHDRVLTQVAERVGPRILHAPARLDLAAREIEQYFDHRRERFDLPIDVQLTHGFAAACSTVCQRHLRHHLQPRGHRRRGWQPRSGARRRQRLRD